MNWQHEISPVRSHNRKRRRKNNNEKGERNISRKSKRIKGKLKAFFRENLKDKEGKLKDF